MKYKVIIFGFETKEEAEEVRKEVQAKYAKWAAVVED